MTGNKMKFDSLIFDLDGTLWDATGAVSVLWNEAFAEVGIDTKITAEMVAGEMGKLLDEIVSDLAPTANEKEKSEIVRVISASENRVLSKLGGTLYPKLAQTLTELKNNYRLFIVSNCQRGYIEAFFTAHGLEHFFEGNLCHGDTLLPKSGTNRVLVERYGLKNPVYIGDTMGDFNAATEAGIPFIHAAYGFGQADGGAGSLKEFSALPDLLKTLEQ